MSNEWAVAVSILYSLFCIHYFVFIILYYTLFLLHQPDTMSVGAGRGPQL